MSARILVVEDEEALTTLLRYNLDAEGYDVETVGRGDDADTRLKERVPDLIVLDWMLPGLSGIELCRRLRARPETRSLPIIMLTARGEESERVRGLATGADDYIVKPFSVPELLARVKGLLRRASPERLATVLAYGDIELDREKRRVARSGRPIDLGPTEYRLLEFFLEHPGRVFSREQLLDSVWGRDIYIDERTVDVHIGRLRKLLSSCLARTKPRNWKIAEGESATEAGGVTECWISFETEAARGYGLIRLQNGQIWTLLTTMVELKGHEEKAGFTRPLGARHGVNPGAKTWKELRDEESEQLGLKTQPYVLIIGGGQRGIQLGVPAIIVEKNARAGDSWRNRYKSLCLHDPVWYDHLPYIDFPKNWPVFSPKDKIGDWLEMYTKVMELNYWTGTTAKHADWYDANKEWTVTVERDGKEITLKPKQLVFATGMSAKPNMPRFNGMDTFKGEQHHSSRHPGSDRYKGKKVVVIGSNNSAHDICAALYEAGVDVTMVQRSTTHIVRSDSLMESIGDLYSERAVRGGMTTAKADLIFASLPYKILNQFQKPVYDKIRQDDADFYAGLTKAGFRLDFGDDDSGLFMKYLRRGSGYYIDVGP